MTEQDNSKYLEYLNSKKWHEIASKRMSIDNLTCQCCGSRGTANNPLEVHHLSYKNLYHEENRIYEDLVTLCHSCHKGTHSTMNRITAPDGRRGWKDNRTIPNVYVACINGNTLEYEERSK